MKYVHKLLQDQEYLELMEKLRQAEAGRKFCRHGLSHFLDVARIGWILTLEQAAAEAKRLEDLQEQKEQIYLTALLHDLGRVCEIERGIPHQEAGAELAEHFLSKIQYPPKRRELIRNAIQYHRGEGILKNDFINIIKRADQLSRNCFCCRAQAECNWNPQRKNRTVCW